MNIKLFWSRDTYLRKIEQDASDHLRERDTAERLLADRTTEYVSRGVELATARGELAAAQIAIRTLKAHRDHALSRADEWRVRADADQQRLGRVQELAIQRLNLVDELRAELRELEEKAAGLEAQLVTVHDDNRALRRQNGVLLEENTKLQLSEVGQLLAKVNSQAKQLAAQEDLLARLEGREEQAVKP